MNQQQIHKLEFQLKQQEQTAAKTYSKLKKMRRTTRLILSDHAIVRFQDRIEFVPVEEILKRLITPQLMKLYEQLGDGTFPVGEESTRVVIERGVIVTVIN